MIRTKTPTTPPVAKLGRGETAAPNAGSPERRNPPSRKQIRVIAETLTRQQTHAPLPEPLRPRLRAALQELDRLVSRIRTLLAEVARRTPPGA